MQPWWLKWGKVVKMLSQQLSGSEVKESSNLLNQRPIRWEWGRTSRGDILVSSWLQCWIFWKGTQAKQKVGKQWGKGDKPRKWGFKYQKGRRGQTSDLGEGLELLIRGEVGPFQIWWDLRHWLSHWWNENMFLELKSRGVDIKMREELELPERRITKR